MDISKIMGKRGSVQPMPQFIQDMQKQSFIHEKRLSVPQNIMPIDINMKLTAYSPTNKTKIDLITDRTRNNIRRNGSI